VLQLVASQLFAGCPGYPCRTAKFLQGGSPPAEGHGKPGRPAFSFLWGEVNMQTILVSACLLGEPTRWHGRAVRPSGYVKKFIAENPDVKIIPVCPEQLGGLPTPRPPVKSRRGHIFETCAEKSRRDEVTGAEVTAAFERGARKTLAIARKHKCAFAILCAQSPSCARTGKTGRLLIENGIEVVNTF